MKDNNQTHIRMKSFINFTATAVLLLLIPACSSKDTALFRTDTFAWYTDSIVQDNFTAKALSPTVIQSNYQSPANSFKSPLISLKFSINGRDNEMLSGTDHQIACIPENGKSETPLITFGEKYTDKREIPADTYLAPNTSLKIRLDMRPVLAQFEKAGYYTTYNGTKIYKSDFKGVYVAGNTSPLIWDFDNLVNHTDLQLTDVNADGIYEVVLKMNPQVEKASTLNTWKLTKDISAFPQYQTPNSLENAIYNMSLEEMMNAVEPDSTLRTGKEWAGVWTRDVSYSIILSMAYLQPKVSQKSLMRKVNANGRIIQDTGTGGAWPVSTDRMIWAVAAWEIYKVTGEKTWLNTIYPIIKKSVEDDLLTAYDSKTGLVRGESSFLDWREQTYPRWMQPMDIAESKNLGTNAVHFQAMTILSQMAGLMNENKEADKYKAVAAKLKAGINEHMWIPEKNYYGQYLYGQNYEILSPRSEALGEALCILFNIADSARQREMVQNMPVVDFGIPCVYPQISDIPPYHNNAVWPFVQSYWLWAAAKTGNEEGVMHSIASIYRAAAMFLTNKENFVADNGDFLGTQINSSNMLWSLSGNISIIHKVLFGIRFQEAGLSFEPFIPKKLDAVRKLTNFKYRNAILDIELTGFGNNITSFMLDGKKQEDAFIPANIVGRHSVKIELENRTPKKQPINLVKNAVSPLMPVVQFRNGKLSWPAIKTARSYLILKNGEIWKEIVFPYLEIASTERGEFQVIAIGIDDIKSFASEPVQIYPASDISIYEVEKTSPKGNFPYLGFSGKGFIEISRTNNRILTVEINAPADGEYAIDWRYANGNGPTNTENKCAIRTLFVDNARVGIQLFPHRGKEEWSNWGYSNALRVNLKAGRHMLKLEFMPENENMNILVNQAMLDYARCTKISN